MNAAWTAILAFLVIAVAVSGGMLLAARLLRVRPRQDDPLKGEVYECGEPALGRAWVQFHPRYYVVALVFVIFDVEAALLFPWAMQARSVGLPLVIPGLIFVAVLMLGWLYAVRKGALEWR